MSRVFGKAIFIISADVESNNEELGILQANYKINKDRYISYEIVGINSKGEREIITVHDCESVSLEDYVE